MARFVHESIDDYSECTVCGTDTPRLCSPCGNPVCANCACPSGCDSASIAAAWMLDYAPDLSRDAA